MFIILIGTLMGVALVIDKRGTVGLKTTDNLEHAKKFNSKKDIKKFMQGHNSENKVIIMSVKEYKEKIK